MDTTVATYKASKLDTLRWSPLYKCESLIAKTVFLDDDTYLIRYYFLNIIFAAHYFADVFQRLEIVYFVMYVQEKRAN
jgi:hypothetical protein